MNLHRKNKRMLTIILSLAIVLSGVIVDYSSQNGDFLQLGQKTFAASTWYEVASLSSGQSYTFDQNHYVYRAYSPNNSGACEKTWSDGTKFMSGSCYNSYGLITYNGTKTWNNPDILKIERIQVSTTTWQQVAEISKGQSYIFDQTHYIYRAYMPGYSYGTDFTWSDGTWDTAGSNNTYGLIIQNGTKAWSENSGTLKIERLALNISPTISVTTIGNTIFSANQPTMTLSGTLYDPDNGDTETVYYRLDGFAGQAGTKAATLLANGSNQGFSTSINVGGLYGGLHNIYVWAADNNGGKSAESCIAFKVDQTPPITAALILTANSSSQITIQAFAGDPVVSDVNAGLHSTPYMFNKNGSDITTWQGGNYTDTALLPNTQYTYKFKARDLVLNTSGYSASESIYTLASTPTIGVNGVTSYTMDLGVSDTNPSNTPYQILVGSNYVTSTGTLSSVAQWITPQNKKITVAGLSPNTTYTVKARAKNVQNVDTGYSSSVSGTTLVDPPSTPTGLATTAVTTTSIKAVWNVVSGATSYDIAVDGNTTNPLNVMTNSYNISGLSAGTSHTISIRAKNGGNPSTSSWSTAITAWTSPSVPTGITVNPASDSMNISWNKVTSSTGTDALGYDINIDNATGAINNGALTTYKHMNLTPNSLHSYKVSARNSGGNGDYSDTIYLHTLSNLPSNGGTDKTTNNSILASWQSNANPEGTEYSLAAFNENDTLIKQNAWTANLGDTLTGLTPDTLYSVKVKARNSDAKETGWYLISAIAKTLPNKPSIPTGVTATTSGNSSINITWDILNDVTYGDVTYDVSRDGILVAQNLTTASYTDTGLTPETTYKYSVQAMNAGGNSNFSTEILQTTLPNVPAVPTGLNSIASTNSITLTWNPVEKATGYIIDNGISQTNIDNVTSTSYTFSNLDKGTEYSYKILAYNNGGDGESTSLYTVYILIDTPTEVTAASSNNRILISWASVAEANCYEVDLNSKIVTTTASAISVEGLNPSTVYTYKVRAKNALTTSDWSTPGTKTTLPNVPSAPANIVLNSTRSTTTISWNPVAEATSYDIMMDSDLILGIADTSHTITGLNPGSSHTYKVRARNAGGKSAWSDVQTISTLAMEPNVPINLKSTKDTNCINISWDQVWGAESYEIEISSNTTTTSAITITSGIGIIDNEVTPDSTKVYRVRSISQGNQSDWSEAIVASLNMNNFGIPENLTGVTSGSSIVLNWDSVNSATGYELQVDGQITNVGTNTSLIIADLEPETNHTFRVRTQNEGGAGEWSSAISVVTLPAMPRIPSNLTAKATENSITLFWNPLIDATSYDLELDGVTIQNIIGTTYSDELLAPTSQHTYRIRARNENNVSEWSNTLNINTLSFVRLTPKNFKAIAANNLIKLTWDADPNASSYQIKIDEKTIETTAYTQYIHTGLNTNEEHIYKVRSRKGAVVSGWSIALTISTLPNRPSTPSGIVVTTTGSAITLKYNSAAGATGYDIQIDGETIDNGNLVLFTKAKLPGTQHSIRVRSKNAGGTSDWSAESTVLIPQETPGITNGIAINSDKSSISISWEALEGASSYDIEANGTVISVGTKTEYKDTGLLAGTSHTYRIRANNEGGNGLWSSIVTKNTTLAIPQNLAANTSSGAIQLSWEKVESATAYELEIDGTVAKITGTAFTQDTLPNQKHIYRVRAINSVATSEWSQSIEAQLPMQVLSEEFSAEEEFEFEVGANNVKDINNVKFTIIYDPSQVDLVDLYSNTQKLDLSIGNIDGSNIKILQLVSGKIVLMVNDDEITGEYSGIVDTILFKAKLNGQVSITYSMN